MLKNICLFCLVLLLFFSCTKTDDVVEIIDGDTFKTEHGETVRLLGINTPEMGKPEGQIAKDFLRLLIMGKAVRLERDATDKDDFGRSLRYVFVGDLFVNAELVRIGVAETRFYAPDTAYKKELEELEKIAVRNRRGLWAFSVFQEPDTTAPTEVFVKKEQTSEIVPWQDAHKYYGQTKTVEGKIVATNNTGKVCFLNFHKDWRKYFTAVIFSSDFERFPAYPEEYYLHRIVRITGLIKEYRGKPEIIIKSPSQIEIVE